jgi:hypothetical protein
MLPPGSRNTMVRLAWQRPGGEDHAGCDIVAGMLVP